MTAEFESDLPQDGEHREGLRKALGENADAGYQERLRAAFLRGEFSEILESQEAGEGRKDAAAGDPPVVPAQSTANGPSLTPATPEIPLARSPLAQSPLAQRTPAGDPAQQPHDGRTPAELRLASILRPGPAPEALRDRTRAAFLSGEGAADLAPLERRALRAALEGQQPRPGFARDLRSEFLAGPAAATAEAAQGASRERAAEPDGGKLLRDSRLAQTRWAVSALAAAAALLLLLGPWGASDDGWRVRDQAQLGDLATFNGQPFASATLPANGKCEFCPGKDTVLSYRDTVHVGLDGETAAVFDPPREGEMLGMRFSAPTGEANLVAFEGAQPMRISTDQVEVVVAKGATSVRYRNEGTCVVVVEGEAQVSLLASLGRTPEAGPRTWTVTMGQRLTIDVDGNVEIFEQFAEQCDVDPHAAERLEDMHALRQSLVQSEAL